MDIFSDITILSLSFGIIIPLLLYWYSTRNHNYWAKKGIPFVKPYPYLGSIPSLSTKHAEETEIERYKQLGRIHGLYEGNSPTITIGEPNLVRDILVKDFGYFSDRRDFRIGDEVFDKMLTVVTGEDWKRIRSIVSPTFSTAKLKMVMNIFGDCTNTLLKNFNKSAEKLEPINVLEVYGAFTMDVIASSAFSTKIDSHNDPNNVFVQNALKAIDGSNLNWRAILFMIMPSAMKKLKISPFPTDANDFFKNTILQIMEQRKRMGQKGNDFLQLLMDAANEALEEEDKPEDKSEDIAANYNDDSTGHAVFKNVSSKRMSKDEVIAQCVIFFLAGYHTTSTTLSIITYLLALNEEAQEKAFQEIQEVLQETDGKFQYDSIRKLKYLDNVISESLRMYPPVIRLDRTAVADYRLKNSNIVIKKGMAVGIPVMAMHYDAEFFPEPEKFNPDRFSAGEKDKLIPYSYNPFGSGPLNCIGMRFALIEMKVCLFHVLSHFIIKPCSKTNIPLKLGKNNGLLRPTDVIVKMIPRTNCPFKL